MRFFYFFRRTGHSREKRQPEDREGGLPEPAPEPTAKGRAASGGKSQSGPREARKPAEFARKTSANKQKSAERQNKLRAPIETEAHAVREKAERVRGKPARYTPSSEQFKELSDKMSAGTRGAAGAGAGTGTGMAAGAAVRQKTGAAKSAALDYCYVSEDGLFRCRLCVEIQSSYKNIRHVNTRRHKQRAAAYEATLQGSEGQEVGGKRREASPSPRPAPKIKAPNARQGAAGKQLVSVVSEPARELRVLLEALPVAVERNARRPRKSSSDDEGSPVDGPARVEKADRVRAKTTSDEAAGVSAVARRKSPRNHQARGGGQRERDAAGEEAGPPAAAAAAPPPVKKGVAAKKAARLSSEEPLPTKRGRPAKKQKVQQSLQVGCDIVPVRYLSYHY